MLLLYGGRDEIVPKAPTEMWVEDLPFDTRKSRRIAWYAGNCAAAGADEPSPLQANQITAFSTCGSAMSACSKFCRSDFFIHSAAVLSLGLWVIQLSAAIVGSTALYGVKSGVS